MKLKYLKNVNDEAIVKYMSLTNKVIKKTHSIGLIKNLDYKSTKEFLNDKISKPKSAILLVLDGEELIGTGYLGPSGYATTRHYGEISKVMVDPSTQGKGIGKKIMVELEKKAKLLGYSHI